MIDYVVPAAIFQQEFRTLAAPIALDLTPVIVGPRKKVVKKGWSPTSETDYGEYIPGEDTQYPILGLPVGESVDVGSVVVELLGVHGRYATLDGANEMEATEIPNEISLGTFGSDDVVEFRLVAGETEAGNQYTLPSDLGDRDVRVGDRLKITHEGGELWTRVSGLKETTVDAVAAEPANDPANPITQAADFDAAIVVANEAGTRVAGDITEDTAGARYAGDLSQGVIEDVYTLECTLGGSYGVAQFQVTSVSGDNVSSVTLAGNANTRMAVGTKGLGIKIANVGGRNFEIGERFTLTVKAPYTQMTLVVADEVADYPFSTSLQVKVVRGGTWDENPKVVVVSTTNVDSATAQVVASNTEFNLGRYGWTAKFTSNAEPQGGLRLGDIYNVVITGQKKDGVTTLKLRDPLPKVDENGDPINAAGEDLSVEFYAYQASVVVPAGDYPEDGDLNWALNAAKNRITLKGGINVFDSTVLADGDETPIPVGKADIAVYYTSTISSVAGHYGSITTTSSIPGILGDIVPENPVAFGVDKAIANSGGQAVYYIITAGDTEDDYRAALRVAERNDVPYFMVPMSQDLSVLDLFKSHVLAMSGENIGQERVTFVSRRVADEADLYSVAEGGVAQGYVAMGPETSPVKYRRLSMPGAKFVTDEVRTGDVVKLNFSIAADGTETFETYLVESVTDEENLLIVGGPVNPVGDYGSPHRIEISRTLTTQEQAELCAAQSSYFGDRRVYNVFPDVFQDTDGADVGGNFMAGALAGLKSSVVAHQPITNFELTGFGGAARSLQFNIEELNTMAAGGTLLVVQSVASGPLFVRHQLSTDMTDVNHQELSVTTNVDSITKFLRSYIRPLVGQYNITPELLVMLETLTHQRLMWLIQETQTVKAGPQILSIGKITYSQDPDIRTSVYGEIPIEIGYPGNRITTRLVIV